MAADDRQELRRKDRFTQHDQLESFREGIAAHALCEADIGACCKCRDQIADELVVRYEGDAPGRVLILEQLDLRDGGICGIARVDEEQERLILRGGRDILNMISRGDHAEICRFEDASKAMSKKGAWSYKNGRKGPTLHGCTPPPIRPAT